MSFSKSSTGMINILFSVWMFTCWVHCPRPSFIGTDSARRSAASSPQQRLRKTPDLRTLIWDHPQIRWTVCDICDKHCAKVLSWTVQPRRRVKGLLIFKCRWHRVARASPHDMTQMTFTDGTPVLIFSTPKPGWSRKKQNDGQSSRST